MPPTDLPGSQPLRPDLRAGAGGRGADDAQRFDALFPGSPGSLYGRSPHGMMAAFERPTARTTVPGLLPGGRRGASGGGRADGGTLRPARGRGDLDGPNFDLDVPPDGYAWWYIDGDLGRGTRALSVIGFIGSVFSPWYAWSGRRDPDNHVCINVATYGPGGRFTMTDRGRSRAAPVAAPLRGRPVLDDMGRGAARDRRRRDRVAADRCRRVRGQIASDPAAITGSELPLTVDGAHVWRPFAPRLGDRGRSGGARLAMVRPRLFRCQLRHPRAGDRISPSGPGAASRIAVALPAFTTQHGCDGTELGAGFRFGADGQAREIEPPPRTRLSPVALAGAPRNALRCGTRPEAGAEHARRAVLFPLSRADGDRRRSRTGVHEALDLRRFRSPLLKPMLALRVPRRARWDFGL